MTEYTLAREIAIPYDQTGIQFLSGLLMREDISLPFPGGDPPKYRTCFLVDYAAELLERRLASDLTGAITFNDVNALAKAMSTDHALPVPKLMGWLFARTGLVLLKETPHAGGALFDLMYQGNVRRIASRDVRFLRLAIANRLGPGHWDRWGVWYLDGIFNAAS